MDAIPPEASASRDGEESLAELAQRDRFERVGVIRPFELVGLSINIPLDPPFHFFDVGNVLGPYRGASHAGGSQGRFQLFLRNAFQFVQLRQVGADLIVRRVGNPSGGAAGEQVLPPESIRLTPATHSENRLVAILAAWSSVLGAALDATWRSD